MMPFLLSIPRWAYAAIAAVVLLIATYFYGHHKGWYERDAEMQAEIARQNELARQTEQKLTEQIQATSTKLQEANHAITEKQTSLDRAIRAGRVRLPTASCVQAAPSAPAPAGDRNQAPSQPDRAADEPSDAERETLLLIAQIAADGDRAINQLNACIDAYNEVRTQLNGHR